jgi:uncharacterized OB-fold protein
MSEIIHPVINSLNAAFWAAAADGRLTLPFCIATRRAFWPPSPLSPFPTGQSVEWRDAEPFGTLRSRIVYRRVFQKRFESVMPYGVGLVELDAGPRLLAHLADPDAPGTAKVGDRVKIVFASVLDEGPKIPTISIA